LPYNSSKYHQIRNPQFEIVSFFVYLPPFSPVCCPPVPSLSRGCRLPAKNLAWFLLVVSDSFALEYEQVKFRE
jgi:hypothetical protein